MIAYLSHIAVLSFFWGVLALSILTIYHTVKGN
jgi:hypothetical protein